MKLVYSLIFLATTLCLQAQEYTRISDIDKRSRKNFEKALQHIQKKETVKAIEKLEQLSFKYPKLYDARFKLAWQYLKQGKNPEARNEFESIIDLKPIPDSKLVFQLINLLEEEMNFAQAKFQLLKLKNKISTKDRIWGFVNRRIEELEFRDHSYSNPLDIEIEKLGPEINTDNPEYLPAFNAEGTEMIFTRRVPFEHIDPYNKSTHEELYISSIDSTGKFSLSEPIIELNTKGNEGAHCFSQDGNILIFTACDRGARQSGCDLYISFKKNGQWSKPKNMGAGVNSRYWESQPSLSADNKTLYFSSKRNGGYGGKDIWKVNLNPGGWSDPVNLGEKINSKGDEGSPFIHADNHTLYFRSNGHVGLGEYDLFVAKRENEGWSDPVNMLYPINSSKDEGALFVELNGEKAYYTSNQFSARSNLDILSFDLPMEFAPEKVSYIKLSVSDKQSKENLITKVELVSLSDSLHNRTIFTDHNGTAVLVIQQGEYLVTVNKQDYIFYSENLNLDESHNFSDCFIYNILLDKVPDDSVDQVHTGVLNNIFFETASSKLLSKSNSELLHLFNLLNTNPQIHISIIGHTDSVGSEEDNLKLSEDRAKSVYNALIDLGADPKRINYEGKGESESIDTNDSEEGRSSNRRTEFRISYIEK